MTNVELTKYEIAYRTALLVKALILGWELTTSGNKVKLDENRNCWIQKAGSKPNEWEPAELNYDIKKLIGESVRMSNREYLNLRNYISRNRNKEDKNYVSVSQNKRKQS